MLATLKKKENYEIGRAISREKITFWVIKFLEASDFKLSLT